MSDVDSTEFDDEQSDRQKGKRKKKKPEDPIVKRFRLEKETKELEASVASADTSLLKNRVAGVLNLFPQSRNSDVTLTLKYWETFQSEIYNPLGIAPADLFTLERFNNIIRVRQKIQNEYGLFPADANVRKRRRGLEEDVKEAVLEDVAPRQIISIFSDETGKNDKHAIVAAVWVLTGRAVYSIARAIDAWQATSPWANRELHFKDFRKGDVDSISGYLDVIQNNRDYLSFKIISVEQARTSRKITEIVQQLHAYMLIRGAQHEVKSNRIQLPYHINVTIDEEQSLDDFALAEIHSLVSNSYKNTYGDQLVLETVKSLKSHQSQMIQLADVIAGAVNRRHNYKGDRNFKDDIADKIIDKLDLGIEDGSNALDSDASAWLSV